MSALISVRVDSTAAIDEKAASAGVTRSEYVRQLIAGEGPGGGAWVVGYYGERPYGLYPTELEALRVLSSGFGQYVQFWPWGERPSSA